MWLQTKCLILFAQVLFGGALCIAMRQLKPTQYSNLHQLPDDMGQSKRKGKCECEYEVRTKSGSSSKPLLDWVSWS
jgi:hypothetical protein